MCLSGSLSEMGGQPLYRDSVQVGCGPSAHTNHGVIMTTAVSPPVGWTAPFVTQQSREWGTLAEVTQAREIQLRKHHLKWLIKLRPLWKQRLSEARGTWIGGREVSAWCMTRASSWAEMWTTSYRVIDCLWSSHQPVIDGPLSRGWNISAGFFSLLRIMMFAWASHMRESAKERKWRKESNREGKKWWWRCTGRSSGLFLTESYRGAHNNWAPWHLASRPVFKTEPRARKGPNEHHGSFITNKRNSSHEYFIFLQLFRYSALSLQATQINRHIEVGQQPLLVNVVTSEVWKAAEIDWQRKRCLSMLANNWVF